MNFFLYCVTLAVFIFTSIFFYMLSDDKRRNEPGYVMARNMLPASVIGLLIFIIIKNKDTIFFDKPELMSGNFFD